MLGLMIIDHKADEKWELMLSLVQVKHDKSSALEL